jgi:protein-disulfide isomerase
MGSSASTVIIVEFADYQCPACQAMNHELHELRSRYPGRVALIYRHVPITSIHPYAWAAAIAAECAGAQGAFEPYSDLLFASQDSIGAISWLRFAREARVPDEPHFESCIKSRQYNSRVETDARAAQDLKIEGTPTLVINGWLFPQMPTPAELDSIVRSSIARESDSTHSKDT